MKMMRNLGALAALMLLAGGAQAQTLTFGTPTPASGPQGSTTMYTVPVNYTAGGSAIAYQADFTIPPEFTSVTVTTSMDAGAGTCAVGVPEAGRIRVSDVDGSLVALVSGLVCTLNVTISNTATAGNYNFPTCSSGTGACANAAAGDAGGGSLTLTVNTGAGFNVVVQTGPTIVQGSPLFNSMTAVPGGSQGGPNVTQNISFSASTGGALGGTTDLLCTTDIGALSNGNQPNIAINATPTTMVFSIAPDITMARVATVTCQANADGGGVQNWIYTLNIGQAALVVGPTLSPPANTTVTVASNLVGAQSTAAIQYTAANGDPNQSTSLTCGAPTGNVILISGAPQSVTTGGSPAPIIVGVVLTDMPQTPAGTITCSANGVDTLFTVNAPAGAVFIPPENIPASSLWSQLALIGLLAALGGVIVAVRRNA